ncbi:MAG: ribonuclease P protein component [Chlorobi bacterium]|nr:ribonuclease P protein component [Chlorobiota bacterium]
MKNTFSKIEKIKSKKEISRIFNDGIFFYSEYLNVKVIKTNKQNQKLHKVGVSVPKKLFKLAVDRNKLKRLIREAYRLNKNIIYTDNNSETLNIFFIYKNKEFANYKIIEDDILKLLKEINLRFFSTKKR